MKSIDAPMRRRIEAVQRQRREGAWHGSRWRRAVRRLGRLDDRHVFERHVVVQALAARSSRLSICVDHVGARHDLAEHRVAPALRRLGLEVEEVVVGGVDEELRASPNAAPRCAPSPACSLSFFRPLLASFLIGAPRRLLLHAGLEAAALDHEALDHAVEHRAVVVAVRRTYSRKFCALDRRLRVVEFDADRARAGLQFDLVLLICSFLQSGLADDHGLLRHVLRGRPCCRCGTARILSTTSMPATTLPNTA